MQALLLAPTVGAEAAHVRHEVGLGERFGDGLGAGVEAGVAAVVGVLTNGAGALAVWSASGLSEHAKAQDIQRTFMRLASHGNPRLGDLVVQSLAAHDGDTSSVYLLLGDPAIRLDLPLEVRNDGNPSAGNE